MPVSTRKHYPIQTMNRSHFAFTRHAPRAQGFSLVEMAMVLLVVGVLAALFLPATNTMMDNNRRKETRTKLEALESAITRFVMTNQRLPCPADGALDVTDVNFGVEDRLPNQVCNAMVRGVVPWRTLGLSVNEAVDAWGTLVTYRVWARTPAGAGSGINTSLAMDYDLPNNRMGMNMSDCKPASTGGATNATNYSCSTTASPLNVLRANPVALPAAPAPNQNQSRGLRVCSRITTAQPATCDRDVPQQITTPWAGTGAAYVLISHGANQWLGYKPNYTQPPVAGGVFMAQPVGPGGGARERQNRNNQALRMPSTNAGFYADDAVDERVNAANPANSPNYFDDIVLHPTVMKVALDAGLGPQP